jgi:integrase
MVRRNVSIPYLQKRNGRYFFRYYVPTALIPILGKREIRQSLKTDSKRLAFAAVAGKFPVILQLQDLAQAPMKSTEVVKDLANRLVSTTPNQTIERVALYSIQDVCDYTGWTSDVVRDLLEQGRVNFTTSFWSDIDCICFESIEDLELVLKQLSQGYYEFVEEAISDIDDPLRFEYGVVRGKEHYQDIGMYQAPEIPFKFWLDQGRLVSVLKLGGGYKLTVKTISDDATREFRTKSNPVQLVRQKLTVSKIQIDALIAQSPSSAVSVQTALTSTVKTGRTPKAKKSSAPLLSQAWKDYYKWKTTGEDKWSIKSRKDNERYFGIIIGVLGDVHVDQIARRDLRDVLESVSFMPRRTVSPYNRMSIAECLELGNVPEEHRVAANQSREVLKTLQSLFSTYLTSELDILQVTPTAGLKRPAKSVSYAEYNDDEVQKYFARCEGEKGWKRWMLPLCAYTGARCGELVVLRKEHFKVKNKVHYFEINESKTDAGIRVVPIHSALIKMGFWDFAISQKDWLFPDLKRSQQVGFYQRKLQEELGIPDEDFEKKPKRLHSFRASFITRAINEGVNATHANIVTGHAPKHLQEGRTYFRGGTGLRKLQEVVEAVGYDGEEES